MDTIVTILNYVCMGIALVVGIIGSRSFKDYKIWILLYVGTAISTYLMYLFFDLPIPYAFLLSVFLVELLNKSKPREGTFSAKFDEEAKKRDEQYAKEHPAYEMTNEQVQARNIATWVNYFNK